MDPSSKDWAGVTNEEIPGHEERSPWPEMHESHPDTAAASETHYRN